MRIFSWAALALLLLAGCGAEAPGVPAQEATPALSPPSPTQVALAHGPRGPGKAKTKAKAAPGTNTGTSTDTDTDADADSNPDTDTNDEDRRDHGGRHPD